MVRQVFPTIYDAPGASSFDQQTFRPRPVADAQNSLLRLKIAPAGATMPAPYSEERSYGTNPPDPSRVYEPGGGETPYDPLTSISTGRPYGEAGYAMPAWSPPTPSSRPSGADESEAVHNASEERAEGGLGGVLSKAVQPQSNAFTAITAPNSNPTDRNRPQMGALNLGGLLGGLFGGGGPAPQPAPPPPPARGVVAGGARGGGNAAPDMNGIAFDANGNPVYNGLDASVLSAPGLQQQGPTQLAATVGKPGWWKPLR